MFEGEKRHRGRPPASGNCVAWTDPMVESLLRLRFETHADGMTASRGSRLLKHTWSALAEEISSQYDVVLSVEQCRNKLKALKSKWLAYHAGGLAKEPAGLSLMDTFWGGEAGESLEQKENQTQPTFEAPLEPPAKRVRTSSSAATLIAPAPKSASTGSLLSLSDSGHLMDVGAQALPQGFTDIMSTAVGAARPKETVDSELFARLEKLVNDRFEQVLEKQNKQLHLLKEQNRLLAKFGVIQTASADTGIDTNSSEVDEESQS